MCKSLAKGGQRCAAHTRPRFESLRRTDPEWQDAAAEYASTPSGDAALTALAAQAAQDGDVHYEAQLLTALRQGENRAAAARATASKVQRHTRSEADLSSRLHPPGTVTVERRGDQPVMTGPDIDEHVTTRLSREKFPGFLDLRTYRIVPTPAEVVFIENYWAVEQLPHTEPNSNWANTLDAIADEWGLGPAETHQLAESLAYALSARHRCAHCGGVVPAPSRAAWEAGESGDPACPAH